MDFHWGEYTYNLAGGSEIFLSELLEILRNGAEEEATQAGADEAAIQELAEKNVLAGKILDDMSIVKSVEFSNPSLVQVDQVWIGNGDDAEEAEEEDDEALGEDENVITDWRLWSLAPFNTNEILTITLKSGEKIEISVTDIRMEGDDVKPASGGCMTVDGVTYNLVNGVGLDGANSTVSKTSNEGDNASYDGRATVYAISAGCTIHNEITYNGNLYKVWNIAYFLTERVLTTTGAKMDAKFVNRAAGHTFRLPEMKIDATDTEKTDWANDGFVAGANNDTSDYKFWKKAIYNPNTNSIDYEMKYFQSMKENDPLDFIFIYDDSITMYTGDRGAPRNNLNNELNETVIRETQGTRIMILSAAQALLEPKSGYNIRVAMGGASTGDSRKSEWYGQSAEGYANVETYLAKYATGATNHNTGLNNALALAKASKQAKRQPIVIYLSDFKDGAYSAATANQLHNLARTYCLVTDENDHRLRARTIATSQYTIYTMSEISDGVKKLENIILDAIGYYMKDDNAAVDNGGAVYTDNGGTVENVTIDGHTTGNISSGSKNAVHGGAVYVNSGTLTVKGSTVI